MGQRQDEDSLGRPCPFARREFSGAAALSEQEQRDTGGWHEAAADGWHKAATGDWQRPIFRVDPHGAGAPPTKDENSLCHGRTPRQQWVSGRTKARWVARIPLLVASLAAQPRCLSRSKGIRAAGTGLAAGTD